MGNKGAFIKFKSPELKPDIRTFNAVVRDPSPIDSSFMIGSLENIFLN